MGPTPGGVVRAAFDSGQGVVTVEHFLSKSDSMLGDTSVSVIIPAYNRREFVQLAIRTVLAQTRTVDEIIVVDDGSSDGTAEALRAAFGDRVLCIRQPNGGVSSARNRGLRIARGRYLALLDSDDEWYPDKIATQLAWLEARPDFGMVLCDVMRMDAQRRDFVRSRRREMLPEDGDILKWVLLNPSLSPSSVLMRREVWDNVGGFDETLATGEDLDFHLRVAAHWKVGLIEQPLVRYMCGHESLSSLARTYDDDVRVIERAVEAARGRIGETDRRRALARAYGRNARGMIMLRRWGDAWAVARKAWVHEPDAAGRAELLRLAPLAARCALRMRRQGPSAPQ